MAICPITVHFSTWRTRSVHEVACEFVRAVVRSKNAQKQLARTSLMHVFPYFQCLILTSLYCTCILVT